MSECERRGLGLGRKPIGPGTGPETDPETDPGTGPGTGPGKDPGKGPATGPGKEKILGINNVSRNERKQWGIRTVFLEGTRNDHRSFGQKVPS